MAKIYWEDKFIGERFWYLTIIWNWWLRFRKSWAREQMAKVRCVCDKEKDVMFYRLRKWDIKSCWCRRVELTTAYVITHWLSRHPMYKVRTELKRRCNTIIHPEHKNYWGRWIKCLWDNFKEFYKDMGDTYEEWLTIDRIDNNWNYCKENCRRTTQKIQCNNKRTNHKITIDWTSRNICEWSIISWIPYNTIIYRLQRWYSEYDAVFTPANWKYEKTKKKE
jgi:hypothetical protein